MPPLCPYRLNWAQRTSWGWWDEWDDTVLQTQDSKFEPWRSEAEHATSRSRRLPTILTYTRGWERNIFVSFKPPRPGTEPRTHPIIHHPIIHPIERLGSRQRVMWKCGWQIQRYARSVTMVSSYYLLICHITWKRLSKKNLQETKSHYKCVLWWLLLAGNYPEHGQMACQKSLNMNIRRPLGYERVYLPLSKVADTPFHIQGDDV